MAKSLFVTGTGTDVGKTYVTGLLVKALHQNHRRAAYYKAAMSGNTRRADGSLIPGDAEQVRRVSGIDQPLAEMCPYVYEAAVSPHLAGRMEGDPVELERVLAGFDALCSRYDHVTVEGSGGILCPLRWDDTQRLRLEDLIRARGMKSLLVADAGLGTINAVVLTAEYMQAHALPLVGILLNRYRPTELLHRDNRAMCEAMTGLPVLACVQEGDTELALPIEALEALYE